MKTLVRLAALVLVSAPLLCQAQAKGRDPNLDNGKGHPKSETEGTVRNWGLGEGTKYHGSGSTNGKNVTDAGHTEARQQTNRPKLEGVDRPARQAPTTTPAAKPAPAAEREKLGPSRGER